MPSRAFAAALLSLLVAYAGLATWVLLRFPNSGDEYAYLLQARLFARGELSMPSAPEPARAALELDHVMDDGQRRRSKFAPGWSLLLVPGVWAGAEWLVNPVVSVLALGLMALAVERIATRRAAWAAVGIAGLSPLFALNAASYFSHNASFACAALALFALVRGAAAGRLAGSLVAGFAIGLGLTVRPLDGVLYGLSALACMPLLGWRSLWAAGAGGALPVLGFLLYDDLQFGSPWTTGYAAYHEALVKLYPGEMQPLDLAYLRFVGVHCEWLLEFVLWSVPAACVLVPLARAGAGRGLPARVGLRFAAALALLEVASIQFIVPNLGDSYGPRYLLPLLLPLGVLGGCGFERAARALEGTPRTVLVASLLLGVLPALGVAWHESGPIHETIVRRSALFRLVRERRLEDAVVIVRYTHDRFDHWFTRNGVDLAGPVIFARDLGREHALRELFPGRTLYRYVWDAAAERPALVELPPERRIRPRPPSEGP